MVEGTVGQVIVPARPHGRVARVGSRDGAATAPCAAARWSRRYREGRSPFSSAARATPVCAEPSSTAPAGRLAARLSTGRRRSRSGCAKHGGTPGRTAKRESPRSRTSPSAMTSRARRTSTRTVSTDTSATTRSGSLRRPSGRRTRSRMLQLRMPTPDSTTSSSTRRSQTSRRSSGLPTSCSEAQTVSASVAVKPEPTSPLTSASC
jgi:hypothetical protein